MDQEPEAVNSRNVGREVSRSFRPAARGFEGEGRVALVERVVGGTSGGGDLGGQMASLSWGVDRRDWRKDWRTNCCWIVRPAGGWGMPGEKVVY